MYGSRLLFRGYGSNPPVLSTPPWPVPTAWCCLTKRTLRGTSERSSPALAACNPAARDVLGAERSRPTVVALTATGDAAKGERFELDDNDEAHPVGRQRLDAAKPLRAKVINGEPARQLAEAAVALVREAPAPAAFLVFGNTPKTARETFERLRKAVPSAEIVLLTGLAREREAARVRARILDPEHGMNDGPPGGRAALASPDGGGDPDLGSGSWTSTRSTL